MNNAIARSVLVVVAAVLGQPAPSAMAQQVYQHSSTTRVETYGAAEMPLERTVPHGTERPGASISGPLSVAGLSERVDEEPAVRESDDVSVTTETGTRTTTIRERP